MNLSKKVLRIRYSAILISIEFFPLLLYEDCFSANKRCKFGPQGYNYRTAVDLTNFDDAPNDSANGGCSKTNHGFARILNRE